MADPGMERKQLVDLSKHPSGVVLTIQNVVSTVNMDCKLDLKTALEAHNAEYNPKHLVTVTMRIREPKTTALIFASGQMVLVIYDENYNELVALFVRAKSIQQSKFAARSVSDNFEEFAHIVQKLGFPAKFKNFKIQNMLSSCDIKFPIRHEGLAYSHGAFCSYEPEICPGLIYRMKQPKMVLLILASGKVVLNGAKVQHEAHAAFENIYLVLTEFRKSQQCRWVIAAAWNGIIYH